MQKKAVGTTFRKINLAHTDDFGQKNDKIRLWVVNNGGTFSKELNDQVTHLVCSKKAWKSYYHIVRDARRRGIKVVSLDWLEDSLTSSTRRPKREQSYEWETRGRKEEERKRAIKAEQDKAIKDSVANFEKHCVDFEAEMQTTGYHIYADPDGFCHAILLVRAFLLQNRMEKLYLKLFESNARPHNYACYVKYTRRGASGREILAIPGSTWEFAFHAFRKFFQSKTRKDWNDRFDKDTIPMPQISDGNVGEDEPFHYEPPSAREPRGLVEQKTRCERARAHEVGHGVREESVSVVVPTIELSDDDDDDNGNDGATHLNGQESTLIPAMRW